MLAQWLILPGLVVANHFLWFRHFSTPAYHNDQNSYQRYSDRFEPHSTLPSFTEIASYFGICIWLVPFALFVSLSAGDNVLPSMGSEYATGDTGGSGNRIGGLDLGGSSRSSKRKGGLVKAGIDHIREWVGVNGEALGIWKGDKSRL